MVFDVSIINNLKDFGLNSYEARIWLALLSRNISTVGELSDIANVPRSRSYDVLESLEKKGFVIMKVGRPIKYIAIPPSEVTERIKKNIKSEAESKEKMLEKLASSDLLDELTKIFEKNYTSVDRSELIGVLCGAKNVANHFSMLLKNAKTVFGVVSSKDSKIILLSKNQFKKTIENNTKINLVIDDKSIASELSGVVSVKFNKKINLRFLVTNDENVLLMLHGERDSEDFVIWIKSKILAKDLKNLFQVVWESQGNGK